MSELKVAATQWEGLGFAEVVLDAIELTVLTREYERVHPNISPPLAYLCVLDNHPKRVYRTDVLEGRLASDPEVERSRFELLVARRRLDRRLRRPRVRDDGCRDESRRPP